MTDIDLTPGISYRDHIYDSTVWDGVSSQPDGVGISVTNGSTPNLTNITTNRLREKCIFNATPINYGGSIYGFEPTYVINLKGRTSAGFTVMDVGCVGIFDLETQIKEYTESSGTIFLTEAKLIIEVNPGADTYTYNIINLVGTNSVVNSRFSLNSLFMPILYNGELNHDAEEITVKFVIKFIGPDLLDLVNYNQFKIGRLWLGNYMPVCFDADWSITLDNPSQINYSAGLDAHPIEQRRRRRGSFPIGNILQSDAMTSPAAIDTGYPYTTFSDMQLQCGKDYPLVVAHRRERNDTSPDFIYPDPYVLFGLMSKDMQIQHVDGPLYQTQIDVVELI